MIRGRHSKRKKGTDAAEKGECNVPLPPPEGLAGSFCASGIIKLAAGVADMQPKIINRQMSTASFDMNSRQYEQVKFMHYSFNFLFFISCYEYTTSTIKTM